MPKNNMYGSAGGGKGFGKSKGKVSVKSPAGNGMKNK